MWGSAFRWGPNRSGRQLQHAFASRDDGDGFVAEDVAEEEGTAAPGEFDDLAALPPSDVVTPAGSPRRHSLPSSRWMTPSHMKLKCLFRSLFLFMGTLLRKLRKMSTLEQCFVAIRIPAPSPDFP
jgi:hypothetical protein